MARSTATRRRTHYDHGFPRSTRLQHVDCCVELSLPVQLRIMTEHTHAIRQAAFTGKVLLDAFLFLNTWVKGVEDERVLLAPSGHLFGEGKIEADNSLLACRYESHHHFPTYPSRTCQSVVSAYVSWSPTRYLPLPASLPFSTLAKKLKNFGILFSLKSFALRNASSFWSS